MKVSAKNVAAFAQKPPTALAAALVFGPDHGAVRVFADQIARSIVYDIHDPFAVTILAPDDIAGDAARLHDELASQSLLGGRRLIRVPHAAESIAAAVAAVTKDNSPVNFLLIEAGDLDKKSKLRAWAESEKNQMVAALACYPEEGADRTRLIQDMLKEHDVRIDADALQLFASLTPPDRIGLHSEVEKIALYAGATKHLTLNDVEAVMGDAAGVDIAAMYMAIGSGNAAILHKTLTRLQDENTNAVVMLRAAQNHFNRLLETRKNIDAGMDIETAINKLHPPVFWKVRDEFKAQARNWQTTKIMRALSALLEAEAQCKQSGLPDITICQQLFFTLARAA